jgi:hypothetical protein
LLENIIPEAIFELKETSKNKKSMYSETMDEIKEFIHKVHEDRQ